MFDLLMHWLTCSRNTYGEQDEDEMVREGYNPDKAAAQDEDQAHNLDTPFAVGEDEGDEGVDELGQHQPWDRRRFAETETRSHDYGNFHEERNAWED